MIKLLKIDLDKRIIGLDVMRSMAILLVLFGHYSNFFYNPISPIIPFTNISLNRFLYLFITGFDGVDLFFVLSGFLIGHSILNAFINNHLDFKYLIRNFWIKRWFRTLPNYLVVLILCLSVYSFIPLSSEAVKNSVSYYTYFIFIQNFYLGGLNFFPESWSLSIEEWFYISFPIVLTLFSILSKKSRNRKLVLLTCILSFIIFGTFFRILRARGIDFEEHQMNLWNDSFRTVMTMRLDAIIYGVLMAYMKIFLPQYFKKFRYLFLFIGLSVLIIAFKLAFLTPGNMGCLSFTHTYYFSMVGIGMSFMLPYFFHLKIEKGFFIHLFTTISVLSYSIYLVNYSLVQYPINYIMPSSSLLFCIIKFITAIVLTLIISCILYIKVETPFMNFRKRILNESFNNKL